MSNAAAPEFHYVSCVPGRLVTRFGTGSYIGATVDLKTGEQNYDPNEVVAIPLVEWLTYVREYGRLVRAGDLIKRTKAELDSWRVAQAAASKKEADDAAASLAAAAKETAAAEKKSAADAETARLQAIAAATKAGKE